jgi:exodeoxyribonuclease VII small subunit
MAKQIGYAEAIAEIEVTIAKIEGEELDVDEITQKVKRISYLLNLCREKLRNTEDEVDKILKEMEKGYE